MHGTKQAGPYRADNARVSNAQSAPHSPNYMACDTRGLHNAIETPITLTFWMQGKNKLSTQHQASDHRGTKRTRINHQSHQSRTPTPVLFTPSYCNIHCFCLFRHFAAFSTTTVKASDFRLNIGILKVCQFLPPTYEARLSQDKRQRKKSVKLVEVDDSRICEVDKRTYTDPKRHGLYPRLHKLDKRNARTRRAALPPNGEKRFFTPLPSIAPPCSR